MLMYGVSERFILTPPTTAAFTLPFLKSPQATERATREDEHAVFSTILGPLRPNV